MTRVLVARLDSAGDVLLAGPAVRAVARGADHVALWAGPRGAAAASLLPGVDEVLVAHAAWIDAEPEPVTRAGALALVDRLAAVRADRALVLTSFHQSPLPAALLLRLAGVPWIAAVSVDYPGSLLDLRLRDPGDVHEADRALRVAEAAGFSLPPGDPGGLAVDVPADADAPDLPRGVVVVHPGASVPARAWAPERHVALVEALVARGTPVVVTGAADERDLCARVAAPAGPHADLSGRLDLAGLAAVLRGARAVVVGNTGPAHLAAAVGTPVVSLFAATVPAARWRPRRVAHALLGDQGVPCAGCRARTCPVAGHPCLGAVGVDDVLVALDALPVPGAHAPRATEVVA